MMRKSTQNAEQEFMAEPVTIRLLERDGAPKFVECGQVDQYGTLKRTILEVGAPIQVPRSVAWALAAQRIRVRQKRWRVYYRKRYDKGNGKHGYKTRYKLSPCTYKTCIAHPFELIKDENPEGVEQMRKIFEAVYADR